MPADCGHAANSAQGLPRTPSAGCRKSASASGFQARTRPSSSTWTTATCTGPCVLGSSSPGAVGTAYRVPTTWSGSGSRNQTVLRPAAYSTPQLDDSAEHISRPRPPSSSGSAYRPSAASGASAKDGSPRSG